MNEKYSQRLREFGNRIPEGICYEPRSISELDFLEPEIFGPTLPESRDINKLYRLSKLWDRLEESQKREISRKLNEMDEQLKNLLKN